MNSALLGVIAQRLVRKVCDHCRKQETPDPVLCRSLGIPSDSGGFVTGSGCHRCMNTGFKGRVGVYEMLRATDAIRTLIESNASTSEISARAQAEGMRPMLADGIDKAMMGLTSLAELNRLHATVEIKDQIAPAGGQERLAA
jgi:type II secretory ATPase GspE/PulE/Tfp pilus assembly ATPase PilB-like protein